VYEDETVLVVDKAACEPTVPQGEYAGSLLARVRTLPHAESALAVHKADVGTSGVVVFARNFEHAEKWRHALGAARAIHVAAVRGITPVKGKIARGEGKAPVTRFRRLAKPGGHSVLRVVVEPLDATRAAPVRAHLASIGHPILGDERHGHAPTNRYFAEKCGLDRTFLHCARLEIAHPDTGALLALEAPLPGDLVGVLRRIGGDEAVQAAGPPVKRERHRPRSDA
jgi:23S rRNA (uracil1939-C5)-methyltransferase